MIQRSLRSYAAQPLTDGPSGMDFYNQVQSRRPLRDFVGPRTAPAAGSRVQRNTYNAQTLPLGDSDLAADNYIGDRDEADYFGRIWADRMTEDGGSKQIFEKFRQWGSPEKIRARGGDPNDLQWKLIDQAIRTGEVDPRLNRDTLRRGLGMGLQETARAQQHKKTFWDSPFGKILKIGGPMAASFVIPGLAPALKPLMTVADWAGRIKSGVDVGRRITGA